MMDAVKDRLELEDSNQINQLEPLEEPATLPGPAPYEEELKDYSKTLDIEISEDSPVIHPEPKPIKDNKG